jgi:tetratricopeptide (TPR) repeat protein
MECGNYTKAAAILDEVVKLKVATSGMLNASVADTLLRLGIAQQSSGDLESALKSLKKAFSIYTSVRGEDSEEATTSLQNLARLYMEFGDYQVCPVNHRFLLCCPCN